MEMTERERKIKQAQAYLGQYAERQAAYHAADGNGDYLDSSIWEEAQGREEERCRDTAEKS